MTAPTGPRNFDWAQLAQDCRAFVDAYADVVDPASDTILGSFLGRILRTAGATIPAVPDTGQAPESPTASAPKAGRGGSGEAETATGAVQAPDTAALAYARSEVDKWLADNDPYCILPTRTEHIPALLARLDELEGTS